MRSTSDRNLIFAPRLLTRLNDEPILCPRTRWGAANGITLDGTPRLQMKLLPGNEAEYRRRHDEISARAFRPARRVRRARLHHLPRPRDRHPLRDPQPHGKPPNGRSRRDRRDEALVGAHGRHHGDPPRQFPSRSRWWRCSTRIEPDARVPHRPSPGAPELRVRQFLAMSENRIGHAAISRSHASSTRSGSVRSERAMNHEA